MSLKSSSLLMLGFAVAMAAVGMAQAAAPETMPVSTAQAAAPATVPVGNPGNTADSTGYGAVAYTYQIGKYEVTNAEYCEFLTGVAKTDTHELYDSRMDGGPEDWGGLTRSGDSGSYTYTVREGMGKKPVNYVTWLSAIRYINWLTNGRGSGDTEKGTYTIDGDQVKLPDHAALADGKVAKWVLANENEWYKAAYYDPNKTGGAGYWQYPAKSDDVTEANLNSNAPSDAGKYAKAVSAYGTFDQGGNVWEYNETQNEEKVGLRGGSFFLNDNESYMRSATRYDVLGAKWPNYGFRVVLLGTPEAK